MSWRAVITAFDAGERFRSRVTPYLHPLAGRPLLWHVVTAVHGVTPEPLSVRVLYRSDAPIAFPDFGAGVTFEAVPEGEDVLSLERACAGDDITLVVDGGAALLTSATLERVLAAARQDGTATLRVSETGRVLARAHRGPSGAERGDALLAPPTEAVLVDDRHALARAGIVVRDRVVRGHEENGVSFLLPDTAWVEVGVRIGADTVIYPGVVMEGATSVGAECVIGPYSRLIDAAIGRGVELGGWNHVVRSAVRNHAVLEAYARRGIE